ncbi:MAG TPA: FtsX-like permease family protein [Polyangiaceae bacterium]
MNLRTIILALRNLTRNRRRSIVTSLTVCFGTLSIVMLQAFVNGAIQNSLEGSIEAKNGAIQVFRRGYVGSDDPLTMNFEDNPALVAKIRTVAGVRAVAPRLDFDGMLSNGSESTMFTATAIDPETEYRACSRRRNDVASGGFALEPGDRERALIGKTLAQSLGAQPGATLVMQASGPHASTNALDLSVRGLLRAQHMSESKRKVTVTLGFAQELLRMPGRITAYVVGVNDYDRVDAIAAKLQTSLGADFLVSTWHDVDPVMRDRARIMRVVMLFVTLTLCLLVATTIVNTTMMAVHERVREIGTMLAVGVRRRGVTVLFLWEAILLGLLSATLGVLIGQGVLSAWLSRGIKGEMPGGDMTIFYPNVTTGFLMLVLVGAAAGTALSALYPAWKASRLRPVEALRAV